MKKQLVIICLLTMMVIGAYAQKKVAVVTFYINKQIDVTEFGQVAYLAVTKLNEDPKFNMTATLKNFHEQFFNGYAKNFPFQLLPESEVVNNEAYKAFVPLGTDGKGIMNVTNYATAYDGYKIIVTDFAGHESEKNAIKIFNQADGVMDVVLHFKLAKTGFGGMGIVRVIASATIILYNKNGDRVFKIDEDSKSSSSMPLIGGVPVMTADKIMPMCENAMAELMKDLEKDLPKLIKKTEAKL